MKINSTKYIKFVPNALTLAQKNNIQNIYLAYCKAKTLVIPGAINSYNQKLVRKLIAEELQVSDRTVQRYYKRWLEYGWATKENNRLRFKSLYKVSELLGGNKKHRGVKVKWSGVKDTLLKIKGYQILNNLDYQRQEVKNKLVKTDKTIARLYGLGRITEAIDLYKGLKYGKREEINFNVALSRQGIATSLERKSNSTGDRYVRRLKQRGFILNEKRNKYVVGRFYYVSSKYHTLSLGLKENGYTYSTLLNGCLTIFCMLPNTLDFNLIEIFKEFDLSIRDIKRFQETVKYMNSVTPYLVENKEEGEENKGLKRVA